MGDQAGRKKRRKSEMTMASKLDWADFVSLVIAVFILFIVIAALLL